ncbi:M48 family metalloprotease [Ahrensia sp. R2A130]|uniref:M48 family metalloprotease n=1 Tax=Ahrensia sp. R2A130 TaxID=744979 RepID=UPI0001E0D091|nr:M48 family metalloprotease [Ahrensia sp. R2A130]EFL90272.1 peptidase M48 Ste24p [Ahrensia sp. R2A130]
MVIRFFKSLLAVFLAVAISTPTTIANAQSRGISLVRDAETEALIRMYAAPLMKAAGLRRGSVEFIIVNDPSFNAFVSGRGMFINTGLLLQAETPDEVIGVIAHEFGHIIGGHQVKLRERMENARRIARWTSLLGVGIAAAGAVSGSGNTAQAGAAIATGGGGIAMRDILQYRRGEETAADRTAVRLLKATGQSPRGLIKTFERLARASSIIGGRIDPYLRSHPAPNERIRDLTSAVQSSPYKNKPIPASMQARHDLVRAKLAAYVGGSSYARSLLQNKSLSENARIYGRAITTYLYGSPRRAIPMINKLLDRMPNNAYAHEMKGEILLRSGRAKQAAPHFRKAVKLDGTGAGILRIQLGHALLESGNRKDLPEAIDQLRKGVSRDPTAVAGYQYLARAYGETDQTARALLASAEYAVRTGRRGQARSFAERAQKGFKRGEPGWLRAQDIIGYKN